MKWFRRLIERFKRLFERNKKPLSKEQIMAIWQKAIDEYSLVDLSNYTDKRSYEYIVKVLKNAAKNVFQVKDRELMALGLWDISEQAERTLLVMIMGEFKTGKSTFINAILGEEILKSDVTPATAVVTMLSYGEKKGVLVHFKDETQQVYSVQELAALTAEGDEQKAVLRETIKYVELFLPHPLLKQLTIVDTPGLNVDNNKHIEATKEFMNNADLVLWVFAAGRAASQTEIASIKELGKRLKPMAIINRIDEIDEEEESVEDVINELQKRLKDYVVNVIGISAFLAQQGQAKKDNKLLEESNWNFFEQIFERNIVSKAEELKKSATLGKLEAFLEKVNTGLKKDEEHFKEAEQIVYNFEQYNANKLKYIKDIEDITLKVKRYLNNKPIGAVDADALEEAFENDNKKVYQSMDEPLQILCWLGEYEGLFKEEVLYKQRIDAYKKMWEEIDRDFDSLRVLNDNIVSTQGHYTTTLEKWKKDVDEYNNSGFFGGAPIFDFAGKGDKLKQRQKEIDREYVRINDKWAEWSRKRKAICFKIVRFNKEMYGFIENTLLKEVLEVSEETKKEIETLKDKKKENERILQQALYDKNYIEGIVRKLEDIVESCSEKRLKSS